MLASEDRYKKKAFMPDASLDRSESLPHSHPPSLLNTHLLHLAQNGSGPVREGMKSLKQCRAVPPLGVEEDGRATYERGREEGREGGREERE